jgi:hypothetical protein
MEDFGLGAGLAAIGFWGFIAVTVIAGVWSDNRKKETQHETVRRMIESGQKIDQETMDKLLSLDGRKDKRPDRDLKISGLIVLPVSAGIALFAMILGSAKPDATTPLLGAAALVACVGLGLLAAGKVASRWYPSDENSKLDRL